MNIRTAMYKAADSIEQNPDLFGFMENGRPDPDCGTPGCALGWVGYHLNIVSKYMPNPTAKALGCPREVLITPKPREEFGFFSRMDVFSRTHNYDWRHCAPDCAKALRLYADKFHPQVIPDNVLSIFKPEKIAA